MSTSLRRPAAKKAAPKPQPQSPAASSAPKAVPAPVNKGSVRRPSKNGGVVNPAAELAKTAKASKPAKPAEPSKAAEDAKLVKTDRKTKATKTVKDLKPAKPAKPAKDRMIRDSFTMPESEFKQIASVKQRALVLQRSVKKSEVLRAGLKALQGLGDAQLKALLESLPVLKTGRPKKAN